MTLSPSSWIDITRTAREVAEAHDKAGENKPFTIVDISRVKYQLDLWRQCLPSVKPYYAMKCNDDPEILKVLHENGCGFDCASQNEIEQVLDLSSSADIILAHPIKTRECICYAAHNNIQRMTFDSLEELIKMRDCSKNIKSILRIKVRGFNALVNLNAKFGADQQTSEMILKFAADSKIPIAGICFHIGSGVEDYRPLARALVQARKLMDFGRKLGHPMEILDIGGGIMFSNERHFEKLGFFVEKALDFHFKDLHVTILAEPGRFLVNNCQYAVVKILQVSPKTIQEDQETEYNVFINDGVYGSFNYVMTEHREAKGIPLKVRSGFIKADIWGPTCCSFDIIERNRKISALREGDWLIYPNNGAYSNVLATEFNGFEKLKRYYLKK